MRNSCQQGKSVPITDIVIWKRTRLMVIYNEVNSDRTSIVHLFQYAFTYISERKGKK